MRKIHCTYRCGQRAFTLIELLVTIAVIGILAAMILPALAKSKARAGQIQCLGQSRQIAMALQMYAGDFKDSTPWPDWGSAYPGWLYTPIDGGPPDPGNNPQQAYGGGLLWSYVKEIKVYWCPLDNTNTPYFPQRLEQMSSYVMNGAVLGFCLSPTANKTHKLSSMKPTAYATWEPSGDPPYDPADVFNDGANAPVESEGPSKRHGTGCNVSSFDGHAEFLKFSDALKEMNDTPSLLWSDPDTTNGDGGNGGRDCGLWK